MKIRGGCKSRRKAKREVMVRRDERKKRQEPVDEDEQAEVTSSCPLCARQFARVDIMKRHVQNGVCVRKVRTRERRERVKDRSNNITSSPSSRRH